jgi:phosphoribosyl-ATP pyrophosphohydrolase
MKNILIDLVKIIKKNKKKSYKISYTSFLFKKGDSFCLKKLKEEINELLISLKKKNNKDIIHETADLIYHLLVVLEIRKIDIKSIFYELKKRMKISGLEEKRRRPSNVRSK